MNAQSNIVDAWAQLPPSLLDEFCALDVTETAETVIRRGHTFRAYPTAAQKQFFAKNFGCARQFWNILVEDLYRFLSSVGFESGVLPKGWRNCLSQQSAVRRKFPYMKEIDSLAFSNARLRFISACEAYNAFAAKHRKPQYQKKAVRRAERGEGTLTYRDLKKLPKFHAKFYSEDSYTTNAQPSGAGFTLGIETVNGRFAYAKLPKMGELLKLRMHRDLPAGARIKSATIKKVAADEYAITFHTEQTITIAQPKNDEESLEKLRLFLLAHASSQICHACGGRNTETKDLRVRHVVCKHCGAEYWRDENAALNIRDEAVRSIAPRKEKANALKKFRAGRHKKKTATESVA